MSDWIEEIVSAWKGHRNFAEWLVDKIQPTTVLELGVDYGYSTFVFASALKNTDNGRIYGVDLFSGDEHTGFRNTYDFVVEKKNDFDMYPLEIIKGDFSEVAKTWSLPIDILHIDGMHTYDAVKHDFETWNSFVKDDGVILFHDVTSFDDVKRFFLELDLEKYGYYRSYFEHSAGLGILTKNKDLFENIISSFSNCIRA